MSHLVLFPTPEGLVAVEPWPGWPRLVYSVIWLLAAHSGTLLLLWLCPGAAAAAEASLGVDPIPFLSPISWS